MLRIFRFIVPAAIFCAGLAFIPPQSHATIAISKQEKAKCVDCHVKMGAKELNKIGECYKQSKDLKACNAKK